MEPRQRDIVNGYIKSNYIESIPMEIVEMIYTFYLLVIESNILTSTEQFSLYDLLYDVLAKQTPNKKIINLSMKLLYRASDNEYSSRIFHEKCNNQGPTICIMHNEYDYIFGGYTSISWNLDGEYYMADPTSFLFIIRPTVEYVGLKETEKSGDRAIWSDGGFGPVFGKGNDVCIYNKCHESKYNSLRSVTYDIDIKKMCGVEPDTYSRAEFIVKDYEVFAIEIEN